MCPNRNCNGQIFYIEKDNELLKVYPEISISIEKDNIPAKILTAFEEAIKCHSINCYIASAIMIRKTLEELCIAQEAKGDNLKKRLKNLEDKITIPKALKDGMDTLRLLGNDAAHTESQTFAEIGKDEIEISIEFTKEILKAVYQYESLLNKIDKLKLKKEKGGEEEVVKP